MYIKVGKNKENKASTKKGNSRISKVDFQRMATHFIKGLRLSERINHVKQIEGKHVISALLQNLDKNMT